MEFSTQNIHNHRQYEVGRVEVDRESRILLNEIIPDPYTSLFVCGKTGSGKSNLIHKLLTLLCILPDEKKKIKGTKLVIVSSTIGEDPIMQKIIEDFSDKIDVETYDDLDDELIEDIVQTLKDNVQDDKYDYPGLVLVFDDIKKYLRHREIKFIISKVRHYHALLIISSQWWKDIDPDSRFNIKYYMLFKGLGEKLLEQIYSEYITEIPFEVFKKMYRFAVKEPHNFLYFDVGRQLFRKNLNQKIILPEYEDIDT